MIYDTENLMKQQPQNEKKYTSDKNDDIKNVLSHSMANFVKLPSSYQSNLLHKDVSKYGFCFVVQTLVCKHIYIDRFGLKNPAEILGLGHNSSSWRAHPHMTLQ